MPSLFRFLTTVGTLTGLVAGTLYFLAITFEPEPQVVIKAVPGIKIQNQ